MQGNDDDEAWGKAMLKRPSELKWALREEKFKLKMHPTTSSPAAHEEEDHGEHDYDEHDYDDDDG